jgi:hypothetical protein
MILKLAKQLNKNLKINYNLNEHILNAVESKIMDTSINSRLKVKICILGEIIVSIFYNGALDIYYVNVLCQRLIEAFYNLLKIKRLKIELLLKRYHDIEVMLDDFLFLLDPRLRINPRPESFNLKDMVNVIYVYF